MRTISIVSMWTISIAVFCVCAVLWTVLIVIGRFAKKEELRVLAETQQQFAQLMASNPTVDTLVDILREKGGYDELSRLIISSEIDLCRQAVAQLRSWKQEQAERELLERREERKKKLEAETRAYFAQLTQSAGKESSGAFTSSVMSGIGPITVWDSRSNKERRIEQDARLGTRVGPVFDALVTELIDIGRQIEFTLAPDSSLRGSARYDEEGRHKRARAIGMQLNEAGIRMEVMQAAYYRVKAAGGDARDLERCWDGVGEWSK